MGAYANMREVCGETCQCKSSLIFYKIKHLAHKLLSKITRFFVSFIIISVVLKISVPKYIYIHIYYVYIYIYITYI